MKKQKEIDPIADRLRTKVSVFLNVPEAEVTPESFFVDDLGADSLDCIELVMVAEEEFGIAIGDAAAERVQRFSDLVDVVKKLVALKPRGRKLAS